MPEAIPPDEEWEAQYRRLHLESPDPLASVPARYLSAQGFAERVLRMIEAEQQTRPPEDVLALVRAWCEQLVWGDE